MRGRVINPFLVSIQQLDTGATLSAGGYDSVFRETLVDDTGGTRVDRRQEKPAIDVKCQIEPEMLDQLQMMMSGQSSKQNVAVVAHWLDLDAAGLTDDKGLSTLRKGDRLVAIKTIGGEVIQEIPTPPGMYLVELRYMGFGIGRQRNLLFLRFEEREQSARSQGG